MKRALRAAFSSAASNVSPPTLSQYLCAILQSSVPSYHINKNTHISTPPGASLLSTSLVSSVL